jgi:hypothetical protein
MHPWFAIVTTSPFVDGVFKSIIDSRGTLQQCVQLCVGGVRILLHKLLEGLPHKPRGVRHCFHRVAKRGNRGR